MGTIVGRPPTEHETARGRNLVLEVEDLDRVLQTLVTQRDTLVGDFRTARERWLESVEEVEAIHDDLYINCNLVEGYGPQESRATPRAKLPDETLIVDDGPTTEEATRHPSTGPTSSDPPAEVDDRERSRIVIQIFDSRRALQKAHDQHDKYRESYSTCFNRYKAQQVNRPNTDFGDEFT